jgi:hypothetical protein
MSGKLNEYMPLLPDILQPHSLASTKCRPSFGHAAQEFWMVFHSILEPIVFGLESDQKAGGTTMTSDHDFLALRQAEIL